MPNKRVLVFGATGEIGGRVARGCVDAGHTVTGVTRGTNTAHRVDLSGVEMLVGDKGDDRCYSSVLAGREFDVVIDSVPNTPHVDLAFKYFGGRIEQYAICSSTGTFVPLLNCPADEEHPWREQTEVNFFWQSERDAYGLDLWQQHKFPVTIFRPTNIIGWGRIPLELWGGRNILYFKLMQDNQTVEIPVSGNILLQSGCNDDLATAFVNGVALGGQIAGEIFIISCKRSITLEHYLGVAREVLGSRSAVECLSIDEIRKRRPDDTDDKGLRFLVEHMCFDISKAERVLGYAPQTSMEQGLERALGWCLEEGLL